MDTRVLDKKVTLGMFVKGIGNRLKSIMAKSLTPEEKLALIQAEMERDLNEKRVTARSLRAKMIALKDTDSSELEPIEKLEARRIKLVQRGKEATRLNNQGDIVRIAKEIKALDSSLSSLETTYETLKDGYEIALENYKTALNAFEHVKNNGSAILFAIKAHQEALRMRSSVKSDSRVDTSFLDELQSELEKSQKELKSDREISNVTESEESILEKEEREEVDQNILNEFKS